MPQLQVHEIQSVFPLIVNASHKVRHADEFGNIREREEYQLLDWSEDVLAGGAGQVEILVTDRMLHGREEMLTFVEGANRAPATIEDLLAHSSLAEDHLVTVIGSIPSIEDRPRLVRARGRTLRFAEPTEPLFPDQGILVRRFS